MIKNNDEVSEILNREIIMIPSSPSITIEEQKQVVNGIYKFIFINENITVVKVNNSNIDILDKFIKKINDNNFRYFNKRTSECIKNHVVTFLLKNKKNNEYFGYTHIDYEKDSNKNWLGIYLHELYRGKKLGNLLLNYTLNSCNLNTIYLAVDTDNEIAIKLYKKNNFIIDYTTNNIHYMIKKYI